MSQNKGFTLTELLITLAIITILSAIAYPSYNQYVINSRRAEAQIALTDAANRMEHYFVANNSYAGASLAKLGLNPKTTNGFYQLSIEQLSTNNYELVAAPLGAQKSDEQCGSLMLNSQGEKKSSGFGSIKDCW